MSTAEEKGRELFQAGVVKKLPGSLGMYRVRSDVKVLRHYIVNGYWWDCDCGEGIQLTGHGCCHAWAVAFHRGLTGLIYTKSLNVPPASTPPAEPRRSVDEELAELF